MMRILKSLFLTGLILMGLSTGVGHAQSGTTPIIIRDTEIETILKDWTEPLLTAAGMGRDSVNLIVVQNPELNAFVAGGANIFLYTGLIEKTESPEELIGVIAHELGHIQGGHLIRSKEMMENASYEAILGTVLGLGAAILTGDGNAAAAVSMGARSQAERRFLAFSRVQESSADQAALASMNTAGINPEGLLSFMQKIESQELLPVSQQSEYIRSHPLTRDRIDMIRRGVTSSPTHDKKSPATWTDEHKRFLAKLTGFISPEKIAWIYDDRDQSVYARYARAIAAYRQNHVEESLKLIDGLLAEEPDNPYFHELKGQMLTDFGRTAPAEISLRRAVELKPDAGLIRIMLAHVLLENSGNGRDSARVEEAIRNLDRARREESRTSRVHRLLATAYGYQGKMPESRLELAEEAVLQRRFDDARKLAESAAGQMKEGSRSWLRAQDILAYISAVKKDDTDKDESTNN